CCLCASRGRVTVSREVDIPNCVWNACGTSAIGLINIYQLSLEHPNLICTSLCKPQSVVGSCHYAKRQAVFGWNGIVDELLVGRIETSKAVFCRHCNPYFSTRTDG